MKFAYFFVKSAGGQSIILSVAVMGIIAIMLYNGVFAPCPPPRPRFGNINGEYKVTETGTLTYVQDERANEYAALIGNTFVYINLGKLYVLVYKDGMQIRAYPCAGGKAATPSPYGKWKVINKDDWGEGFGGHWLGLNVPWGEYGIHGTMEPWFIGRYNVSRGCIRLYSEDAEELYDLVPFGSTVIIENDNAPFRVMEDGMVGSDIRDAQIMLKSLGLYQDSIDGAFGEAMFKGVVKFQKKYGLPVTGLIDQATLDSIVRRYNEEPLE